MSWRAQGMTGSNNIPLGTRRKFGGDAPTDDGSFESPQPAMARSEYGSKRGRSPVRAADIDAAVDGAKRRKKRNRWGAFED